jgi:UDP-glucose 4-epimerase
VEVFLTKQSKILVTGGCGYIGSHVCAQLSQEGFEVLVLDNLSTGYRDSLLHGETLIQGDFGNTDLLRTLFSKYSIKTIFHFAASIVVEDSVKQPFAYYENNSIKFYTLLREAEAAGVDTFVLSSTAAVYGLRTDTHPVREQDTLSPMSPYGRSKVFDEWLLEDVARVSKIRHVTLRYFNVAGASPNGKLGQRGKGTHLIKAVCETALNLKKELNIYGTDYDTEDGTCIRDYIHVEDLASAHLGALRYLNDGGASITLNCGYKRGYSVKEVVQTFESLLGRKLPVRESSRRPGDVPFLIADNSLLLKTFSWKVKYNDLRSILESAWQWEQKL